MEKYLYFRTEAALADDDGSSSYLYPVSAMKGMAVASDTALWIYFHPMLPNVSDGQDGNFSNSDVVIINVNDNSHQSVMKAITDEIAFGRKSMIVVADDCVDDEREAETSRYISPDVTSCGTIAFQSSFS